MPTEICKVREEELCPVGNPDVKGSKKYFSQMQNSYYFSFSSQGALKTWNIKH